LDDNKIRGHSLEISKYVTARLNIGLSSAKEFANALEMTNGNNISKKNLGGYAMLPRMINVNNEHCCVAYDIT